MKEYTLMNVSPRFLSVHLPEGRVEALPPGASKPLRSWFRKPDGSADPDAAKANDSLKQHLASGDMKLVELEVVAKVGNVGKLYNEDDPEEARVQKILAYRRKVKEEAKAAAAKPMPRKAAKEPKE